MRTEKRSDYPITGFQKLVQGIEIINRKFLILLVVVGLIVSLVACAGTPVAAPSSKITSSTVTSSISTSATPKPTPSTTSTTISSTTPSSPAVNKNGGILRIAWPTQVGQFGYPPNLVGPAGTFASPCLEGLIMRSNDFGVYTPLLATSWTLAPDKSSYTFQLRKSVKFQDGSDFNAAAVKWNLDHILVAPGSILKTVQSFSIIDDYTIKANLKSWNVLTIDDFADGTCYIYSPTAYEKNGAAWADTHPIGTGPFIFTEWQQNQWYKYAKNPNYWDRSLPYLDGIEWDIMVNPTTTMFALQKGDIDVINQADADTTTQMLALGFKEEHMMAGHYILNFDSTNNTSIWSDKRLREALEYGIDKAATTKALGKGYDEPIYEIIFGAHGVGDPGTTPRKYDPVKARQLLADAGYPGGGIKVQLTTNQLFATPPYNVAVQSDLAKIGIQAEINVMSSVVWSEHLTKIPVNNELRYNRQRGSNGQPLPMLNLELASKSTSNLGVKRPDGWDTMLANLLQEVDPVKQVVQLENMEKLAYTEAMFVPLFGITGIQLYNAKLKSDITPIFFIAGGPNWLNLKYVYFAK